MKCDEGKPSCGQCNRAGRRCEGYNSSISQKELQSRAIKIFQRSLSRSDSQLLAAHGTPQEREYIHLFCTQTTCAIAGFFASDLWSQLLPQLGQGQPVVRHAIAAVGAAHRQYLDKDAREHKRVSRFILQQYNLATGYLVECMNSPKQNGTNLDLTLVICSLFVCLEILRDNHEKALDHVEAGLNIIAARENFQREQVGEREIAEMFSRFHIELSLFGRQPKSHMKFSRNDNDWVSSGFTCVSDARGVLDGIANRSIAIIRNLSITGAPYSGDSVGEEELAQLNTRVQGIKNDLDAWHTSFEAFMQTKQGRLTDPRAPLALRIHYHLSVTWTLSILRRQETEMDQYKDDFAAMVELAEELLKIETNRPSSSRPERAFNLDPGVIRPLHWTAIKCRDPLIRRQALRLMSVYPRKESFWNWRRSVVIGEMIMKMEEREMLDLPVEERIPLDHQRVYETAYYDDSLARQTWLYMWSKPEEAPRGLQSQARLVDWSRSR